MARKSRKKSAVIQNIAPYSKKTFLTALYVRLSNEEGMTDLTQKIRNQKELLTDYISDKSDLELVGIYCDNGYTGTNFDRPEWNRLMEDVRAGKVNCIVVKDLSRLGRNYIEAGNYLEKVFPFLGVRFIAVSDQYDSDKPEQEMEPLLLPLKNIINASYAKDLSGKIRSARHMQRSRGEYTGGIVPYGYKRDKNRKGKFVIDDKTAPVVRQIFEAIGSGMNYSETARLLNEQQIPSPKGKIWSYATIKIICANPVYIGNLVQGMNSADVIDLVVCEHSHEAIIDRSLFEGVQRCREKLSFHRSKENSLDSEVFLFQDMLIAANTSRHMTRALYQRQYGSVKGYRSPKVYDERGNAYPIISIQEQTLIDAVRETILQYANTLDAMKVYLQQETVVSFHAKQIQRMEITLEQYQKKKQRLNDLLADLYSDTVEGMIKPSDYKVYYQKYTEELKALDKNVADTIKKRNDLKEMIAMKNPFLERLRKFGKDEEITRELLECLVKQIIVHSSREIEVHFTFEDEFKALYRLQTEQEAERSINVC